MTDKPKSTTPPDRKPGETKEPVEKGYGYPGVPIAGPLKKPQSPKPPDPKPAGPPKERK